LTCPKAAKTGLKAEAIQSGQRLVDFDSDGVHLSAAYDLGRFEPDMEIAGPAIIEDKTTTIVVNPGCTARMDAIGNLHIELGNCTMSSNDPFTQEIIKNALSSPLVMKCSWLMAKTSMSPIIYEALDYSVGITNARGDLIAQGNGTTVFLGMIDSLVQDILAKFGPSNEIFPEDVFISNDPYQGGGTHLCDVAIVKPIFFQDELVAFAMNKAHWVDVGGMAAGSFTTDATEIFQEGLQIPTIKVMERGKPVGGIMELLQSNIRMPKESMGDFWAGMAANTVAEVRIVELFDRYGRDAMCQAMDDLLDYGEAMIAAELKQLPQGTFYAEDWIDDDGITDEPLKVCVRIGYHGRQVQSRLTGSAPQTLGADQQFPDRSRIGGANNLQGADEPKHPCKRRRAQSHRSRLPRSYSVYSRAPRHPFQPIGNDALRAGPDLEGAPPNRCPHRLTAATLLFRMRDRLCRNASNER
jgi:hypothetical protein